MNPIKNLLSGLCSSLLLSFQFDGAAARRMPRSGGVDWSTSADALSSQAAPTISCTPCHLLET